MRLGGDGPRALCVVMCSLVLPSPAKINLLLAITGRRADGFHSLVSVVAPLAWGDELSLEPTVCGRVTLECDDPAVPVGEDNLIVRAALRFRQRSGWSGGARFVLKKRIPMGAGLGGGSSNAATALRGLNALAAATSHALPEAVLAEVAAELGSDCPLFLSGGPVVMRGRGELVEKLPSGVSKGWAGQRLLVFRPGFAVATVWAYKAMAARPGDYLPEAEAERRLREWLSAGAPLDGDRLFNTLELPVYAKYPALPVMASLLRERHGLAVRMSGSGSACFAFLPDGADAGAIKATVREGFGADAWMVETNLP